tara:strand:+ start:9890 stop:10042 length:153 start_codon:yes stop_codon:yes gene_type:complete
MSNKFKASYKYFLRFEKNHLNINAQEFFRTQQETKKVYQLIFGENNIKVT